MKVSWWRVTIEGQTPVSVEASNIVQAEKEARDFYRTVGKGEVRILSIQLLDRMCGTPVVDLLGGAKP